MNAWSVELALLLMGRWKGLPSRVGLTVPAQPGAIWIHGASLGEATIARRLAERLPNAFVTTDTEAGLQRADGYRPFDHPFTLAPLWSEARVRLLVFVESAWWPALARLARTHGVPTVLVAARPSATMARRAQWLGWPDAVIARDEVASAWFQDHAIPVIGVGGSLKGGVAAAASLWDRPFLVGISTRPGDEAYLLHARDRTLPGVPLLLAPRHLSRLPEVEALGPMQRFSALVDEPHGDVLLDTHGDLSSLLQGAGAAFVGGTFDPALGGQSADEAQAVGVPVVHGPHTSSNPIRGGHLCPSPEQLPEVLRHAWMCATPASAPSIDPVVRWLRELAGSPAPESAPRPWLRALAPLLRRSRGRAQVQAAVPVVAVGSSNARGAGKTSTGLWIAARLRERGHRVGVVTRGVGRTLREVGTSAQDGVSAAALGDEGALYALAGFDVAAHRDRSRALAALQGCTVIVSEDGLQCGLGADLRVATIDCRYPSARGPLPSGERREPRITADVEVAHHSSATFPKPWGAFTAHRDPGPWNRPPPADRVGFAGIGRPADFFASLGAGACRSFPDHHRYSDADMVALSSWAAGRALCTTDRDFLRVPSRSQGGIHWRGLSLSIPHFPLDLLP